jgi:cytoskeletal protein RodZ
MSRGIELEEIAAVTKINERYLRSIEENRYGDLPASVYVRGFLKQYARTLHLDVRRVADTYMARYDERGA